MSDGLQVLCKKLNFLYQKLDDFIDEDVEKEYLNNEIKTIRLEILQMEISKRFKELEE
jgi:hypothetical protein